MVIHASQATNAGTATPAAALTKPVSVMPVPETRTSSCPAEGAYNVNAVEAA